MSDHRLYKLHAEGKPVDDFGPYTDEARVIDALEEINQNTNLAWGDLVVHVYETDTTPLGIGRKYLGSIEASAALMHRKIPEDLLGA